MMTINRKVLVPPRNIRPRFRGPPIHNTNNFKFPNPVSIPQLTSTVHFIRPGIPNTLPRTINNEISRSDRSINESLDSNNNEWFSPVNNTTQLPVPQPVVLNNNAQIFNLTNPLGLEVSSTSQITDSSNNQPNSHPIPSIIQPNSFSSRPEVNQT